MQISFPLAQQTLEMLWDHKASAQAQLLLLRRWLTKDTYGKVPRYLQNIKVGLARQHADKQAAKEAALVPPGMRIMPEEERLEMLGILDESRQDIEAKLQVGGLLSSHVQLPLLCMLACLMIACPVHNTQSFTCLHTDVSLVACLSCLFSVLPYFESTLA